MFDINLQDNEKVIVYDNQSLIYTTNKIVKSLLVLTNVRLIVYIDANSEIDYMNVLHYSRGVYLPENWEKKLEILIFELKNVDLELDLCSMETNNGDILKFKSKKVIKELKKILHK